ncbi:ketoacyl-ACP synthase III family protein [Saccharothrix syringae]|uniref:3-oxoacyl-ACP synthase n=1 Tax=Saccharothrix syringae TaxID=103733 RepID=A0A5Q0GZ10_SACSY|nr:ketoacyl-ACP synthase III family protein [Saccharothrix syringae]QFZ18612.1 3-oxoacyl-ACP synthase [Saccharothrix syringae]
MRVAGAVTLAGCALWLPEECYTARQAQANGAVSTADSSGEGIDRLPTAAGTAPTLMAVLAARRALDQAGVRPDRLALLAHAWVYDQGPQTWTPPHRVARELGALDCAAVGVRQMSNGGASALQAAVAHLLAEPRAEAALVTTADAFTDLPYDRWRPVPPLGDGATAAVLTRGPGRQVVEAIASAGDSGLELSYPTAHPFEPLPGGHVRTPGAPDRGALRRIARCVGRAVDAALEDAGLAPDDPRISAVLPPRVGRTLTDYLTGAALAPPLRGKTVASGRHTGHLGSGDLLANLAEHPPPAAGDFHVHISMGAGFTSTCLVTRGT